MPFAPHNSMQRRLLRWALAVCCVRAGLTDAGSAEAVAAPHRWIQPGPGAETSPVWGHADGLRVGLAPLPGPRGLLRIYAPYLGHQEGRVINFVAVEPIPQGQQHRGLSELEFSQLDAKHGKRFWSRNDLQDITPQSTMQPASGWIEAVDGVECLRVYILVERFDNGAHVYARLTFRADRPYELGIATYAHADSAPLEHCIVTATMGNYARLRRLELAHRTVEAGQLWPDYHGDGFTPHARFSLDELRRTAAGGAIAVATTNEPDPVNVQYAPGTREGWRYRGEIARQFWRCDHPPPRLQVLVNGRTAYWASQSPIPGGVSFENFEMVAPFRNGEERWFGVEPIDLKSTE